MPATSAEDLITGAFDVLGIYAPGESISAADANGALRRLNLMMSGLRLQPLSQPVQSREVFSLTSDVGAYTMGPGGDFDTTRPTEIIAASILLNSEGAEVSVTSITRSGSVATVTATGHGASEGQNVTIKGASPAGYNGTFSITTVPTVDTFTYLVPGALTTPATGTITLALETDDSSVVEVPRSVITDEAWANIRVKSLRAGQFTSVYYNPTFSADLGSINLWPIPNVSDNSLVLYRLQPLTSFANLTTQYYLPDGCAEALEYNLARRLWSVYPTVDRATAEEVFDMARTTLANFKRANTKLVDLSTDPALTKDRAGGYNIITGTGGGSTGA